MTNENQSNQFFRKKVYASIYAPKKTEEEKTNLKKIVPSTKISGIREEFKKVFLPLLIDVFELRRSAQNYKIKTKSSILNSSKPADPEEILKKLQELQMDIEESRRWCEGVILQIQKGIDEAKEALQFIEKMGDNLDNEQKKSSLKKRLVKFFLKK
jgi:hypothetical protein